MALRHGVGLHVDSCLGGFILPFGQELGYDIPVFDYRRARGDLDVGRHPQVRLRLQGHVGADLPRQGAAQRPVLLPHRLERRQVLLAGHGGLALGWAARRHLGVDGPARSRGLPATTPGRSSRPRPPCRTRCGRHPELRILGKPTFLFSFTSDAVRHLPRQRLHAPAGLALQRPAVPERAAHGGDPAPDPAGVAEAFAADLADAVAYAREHADEAPESGAIYGGVAGGMTDEADEFIRAVMADMMDAQQSIPADA